VAVAFPFYNLFVGAGVALAAVLFQHRLQRFFEHARDRERALLLLLAALPCAAIGSWVFDRVTGASSGPILPLRGLAFYGGLLGAFAAVSVLAPLWKLPLLRVLDAGAPAIALGHAIGRIGCGVAGCCYGHRVDAHSVWGAMGWHRVPTQWIESMCLGVVALVLARTPPRREGDAIATYFAAYGAIRILLETLRDDPRGHLPALPMMLSPSQWISVVLLLAAAVLLATRARRPTMDAIA
jgi:phosphatidylglycerol:prolipoprotein diacylglycerol transferase